MQKKNIPIDGMHCRSCEILLEGKIKKVEGVSKVEVDQKKAEAVVYYHQQEPDLHSIAEAVQSAGYRIGTPQKPSFFSKDVDTYRDFLKAVLVFAILYGAIKFFGISELSVNTEEKNLWVVLLVGLVAGVSTCMALIGGLVLGFSARHSELHPEATKLQKFRPHIFFNAGRISGYALFGGLVGLFGTAFKLTSPLLGALTMAVGVIMIFLGLKLIEIFPALAAHSFTLPARVSKFFGIKNEVKEYSHTAAFTTGALTFFLPCGFTQAMQVYALSTGNFVQGALIMSIFALGTSPGLLGIGILSSFLKGKRARVFYMTAGIVVLLFGITSLESGKVLLSPQKPSPGSEVTTNGEFTELHMVQDSRGYTPLQLNAPFGRPVRLIITSKNPYNCASVFVIPSYGIEKNLASGENIIEFTPTKPGPIQFSCSMGMYRGVINIQNSSL